MILHILCRGRDGFPRHHGALAIGSPVVPAETSVLSQHRMTGNQPADRICTNSVADSASARADSDGVGDHGVGRPCLTAQVDGALPYLELKVCTANADF